MGQVNQPIFVKYRQQSVYFMSTKRKRCYEKTHNTLKYWSQRAELNRRPTD